MEKATRQHTKSHNTSLVLKTIYDHTSISRADIARETRLTRPTVSRIVSDFIEGGLVIENGLGPSAGGKRPTLLNIAHDNTQLLCLDLGDREFRGAVVNLRGEILARVYFPTNGHRGPEALDLVYQVADTLIEASNVRILGIGVGTPGLTNPMKGIIGNAVNLGWSNLPLRNLLQDRYGLPIYVANDSHMAALGEYTFGRHRESKNLIVIKIGRGVGAGIVINGQPYYGDGYGAGEIGHVTVDSDRQQCRCGNFGCLEASVSTRALMKKAGEIAQECPESSLAGNDQIDWDLIVRSVAARDPASNDMITKAGKSLGYILASLVGTLNIQNVVISGRVSQFGDVLIRAIEREARLRVLPSMAEDTHLSFSLLGKDIVILGCSAMIMRHELGII
ncbi:MAG: ROK family transcriptional regulator [Candidatus Promineifilaceae bacterium]